MSSHVRNRAVPVETSIFDDHDALTRIVVSCFERAAKAAVAENDRLGITTHGAVNDILIERPAKTPKRSAAE